MCTPGARIDIKKCSDTNSRKERIKAFKLHNPAPKILHFMLIYETVHHKLPQRLSITHFEQLLRAGHSDLFHGLDVACGLWVRHP